MWQTSLGERMLTGAEADLFRASVDSLVDWISVAQDSPEDLEFISGIDLFDTLANTQKLALLCEAARFLLTETPETLPLTATNEAVIGAVFEHLRQMVRYEVDDQRFSNQAEMDDFETSESWRLLILLARDYVNSQPLDDGEIGEPDELPLSVHSTDMDNWDLQIEFLADRILWDRDYELADTLMDVDPDAAAEQRQFLGISEDYFSAIAPDVNEEELEDVIRVLREMVRPKPR